MLHLFDVHVQRFLTLAKVVPVVVLDGVLRVLLFEGTHVSVCSTRALPMAQCEASMVGPVAFFSHTYSFLTQGPLQVLDIHTGNPE